VAAADRVERSVPDLVEHADRSRSRVSGPQPGEPGAQLRRPRARSGQRAGQRPQPLEVDGYAVDRRRVRDEHRHAARDEWPELRRRRIGPGDDQVGRERHDALEVERAGIADSGLPCDFRRPIGRGEHADHALAGASGIQQLGGVRRKADNSYRGHRQSHRHARIVDRQHRGQRCRQPCGQPCGERRRQDLPDRRDPHRSSARTPANTVAPPVA
jgi:hypothetical protein